MVPFVIPEMTWVEAAEAFKHAKVAIIPVGSTEQHGPGIKLRKDAEQAYRLAKLLEARVHPLAIVTPLVSMGISAHHGHFPGTCALRPETFMAVIQDIVRSMNRFGIQKFLLINTHGENSPCLGVICLKLRDEMGVEMAYTDYSKMAADVRRKRVDPKRAGHGSDTGLAVASYLDPTLVEPEMLQKGDEEYYYARTGKFEQFKINYPYFTDEVTSNGVYGDPAGTSVDLGQEMVETSLGRIEEFVRDYAAKPKPKSKLQY